MKSKLLPLFLLLFLSKPAFGSSPIGADITYRYLGNNKYYVEVSVQRDCRSLGLSGLTFGWFAGKAGNTSCGSGTLSNFKRVKITDISVVHSVLNKPCSPQNTASAEGIELHTYVDTLDMSKSPFASVINNSACTELSIYVNKCCRPGSITTGSANSDFTVTTTIFIRNLAKCPKQNNSSPYFQRNYPGVNYCNATSFWSLGAVDSIDRDSLSFQLVPALTSIPSNSVTYTTPFTYQYPVTPYCPGFVGKIDCSPNTKTNPARGTYLNPNTGELIYTAAKCDEVAIIAISVSEFRRDSSGKMLLIARNTRDARIITKDNGGNNYAPTISGNYELTVAAGGKLCNTFTFDDLMFTPFQTKADTIQVDWAGSSSEPSWKFKRDSLNPSKGELEFCWQTKSSGYSEFPYTFTIFYSDNHYPLPKYNMRTFSVQIKAVDTATIASQTNLICASAKLSASLKRGDKTKATYSWVVRDSATQKTITTSSLSEFTVQYLKKGVYEVQLNVSHPKYAYAAVKSYFKITADLPTVQLGQDVAVCKGSSATLVSSIATMKAPVRYSWGINGAAQSDTSSQLVLSKVDSTLTVSLKAEDALGCVANDTVSIVSRALPKLAWTTAQFPSQCWSPNPLLLNNFIASPAAGQINKNNFRISGSLTKYGPNGLVDSQGSQQYYLAINKISNFLDLQSGKTVKETLTLWYKDSFGCENTLSSTVTIYGTPIVRLLSYDNCQSRMRPVYLDSLILQPKTKFGYIENWTLLSGPKTDGIITKDQNNAFVFKAGDSPDNAYAGIYTLQYCVTNQVTGCYTCDTTQINMIPQGQTKGLSIPPQCYGTSEIDLSTYFEVNGKPNDPTKSSIIIYSRNGNTNPNTWSNASLIDFRYMPKNMPWGTWVVKCDVLSDDSFCNETGENTIVIYPNPVAAFKTSPTDSASTDLPIFTISNTSNIADNSNLSYQWYFDYPDLNNQSTAFAPDINYPATNARYSVWLIATSDKGCADTAIKTLKVGNPVNGIASISLEQFRITPQFVVSGIAFTEIETEVYDAAGKLLARSNNNAPIALPTGIYLYKLSLKFGDTTDILHLSGKVFVE